MITGEEGEAAGMRMSNRVFFSGFLSILCAGLLFVSTTRSYSLTMLQELVFPHKVTRNLHFKICKQQGLNTYIYVCVCVLQEIYLFIYLSGSSGGFISIDIDKCL